MSKSVYLLGSRASYIRTYSISHRNIAFTLTPETKEAASFAREARAVKVAAVLGVPVLQLANGVVSEVAS